MDTPGGNIFFQNGAFVKNAPAKTCIRRADVFPPPMGKHFSVNAELAFNIPWREQFSALWHIVMTSRNANPPDCFRNQRKQFFRGRDNDGVTLNFHVFPPLLSCYPPTGQPTPAWSGNHWHPAFVLCDA